MQIETRFPRETPPSPCPVSSLAGNDRTVPRERKTLPRGRWCVWPACAEEYITCNAICPGYVLTPLVEAQIVGWVIAKPIKSRDQPTAAHTTKYETVDGFGLFACSDINRHKCPNLQKPELAIAMRDNDLGGDA
jgi:hypothetical protein